MQCPVKLGGANDGQSASREQHIYVLTYACMYLCVYAYNCAVRAHVCVCAQGCCPHTVYGASCVSVQTNKESLKRVCGGRVLAPGSIWVWLNSGTECVWRMMMEDEQADCMMCVSQCNSVSVRGVQRPAQLAAAASITVLPPQPPSV